MNDSIANALGNAHISGILPARQPAAALVVDDEPSIREFMRFALSKQCALVEVAESANEAEQLLERYEFDVLIVDVRLQGISGVDWITARRIGGDRTPVIFMSADIEAVSALDASVGAGDEFIEKPFSLEKMLATVARVLARRGAATPSPKPPVPEGEIPSRPVQPHDQPKDVVAHSEAMQGVMSLIQRVAGRSTTVLLDGESGTGKEVAARCLHHYSGRSGHFVPVNCGSISADLLESELFGHVRGAFTGATQQREGLFSYANGGTLLLDEICEMPFAMQAKLLRILEERSIRPVGSEREQAVDVRIIAATNKSMPDEVARGTFREDLYYRLNVLVLRLPPLRERPGDIVHLIHQFSNSLALELELPPLTLTEADIRQLQAHHWPGNVRELKNLVERAMLLDCSPVDCMDGPPGTHTGNSPEQSSMGYPDYMALEDVEKLHILKVIKASGGNKSEAARRLMVSRKTLERKVKMWDSQGGLPTR